MSSKGRSPMRNGRLGLIALLSAVALGGTLVPVFKASAEEAAAPAAEIGKPAPEFALTSPNGKSYSLANAREGEKATVVMFIATQCPVSNAYNERMVRLAQDYAPKKVRFLGINANK